MTRENPPKIGLLQTSCPLLGGFDSGDSGALSGQELEHFRRAHWRTNKCLRDVSQLFYHSCLLGHTNLKSCSGSEQRKSLGTCISQHDNHCSKKCSAFIQPKLTLPNQLPFPSLRFHFYCQNSTFVLHSL